MKLLVKRVAQRDTYTIGKMYIDGAYFADTLEDKVRPDGVKVYGETAIPAGTYKFIMSESSRFKKVLPLLLNVPMFEGIRIHGGNDAIDTHGCILVGINDAVGQIHQSQVTLSKLIDRINASGLHSWEIEIQNA